MDPPHNKRLSAPHLRLDITNPLEIASKTIWKGNASKWNVGHGTAQSSALPKSISQPASVPETNVLGFPVNPPNKPQALSKTRPGPRVLAAEFNFPPDWKFAPSPFQGKDQIGDARALLNRCPAEKDNDLLRIQCQAKDEYLKTKDSQLKLRDSRIKDKDKMIVSLQSRLKLSESAQETLIGQLHITSWGLARKISELDSKNTMLTAKDDEIQIRMEELQEKEFVIQCQKGELRIKANVLRAREAELQEVTQQKPSFLSNFRPFSRFFGSGSSYDSNQEPSFPLLSLPPELRMTIYHEALVSPIPIDIWPILPDPNNRATFDRSSYRRAAAREISINLVRVSRQIHSESIGVLYACNRFRFSDYMAQSAFNVFIDHIGNNCRFLTHVTIRVDTSGTSLVKENKGAFINNAKRDLNALCARLHRPDLTSPAGPHWRDNELDWSESRLDNILQRLPCLRYVTRIVPHDLASYRFSQDEDAAEIEDIERSIEARRFQAAEARGRKVQKTLLFIRRSTTQKQLFRGFFNLDDDVEMGRVDMAVRASALGWRVRYGSYCPPGSYASYVADEGEEEVGRLTLMISKPLLPIPGPVNTVVDLAVKAAVHVYQGSTALLSVIGNEKFLRVSLGASVVALAGGTVYYLNDEFRGSSLYAFGHALRALWNHLHEHGLPSRVDCSFVDLKCKCDALDALYRGLYKLFTSEFANALTFPWKHGNTSCSWKLTDGGLPVEVCINAVLGRYVELGQGKL